MNKVWILLLAALVGLFIGCTSMLPAYISDGLESLCIKGRISAEQAAAINERAWRHTPEYCEDEHGIDKNGKAYIGQSDCRARKYDRILRAECSNFAKILERGD